MSNVYELCNMKWVLTKSESCDDLMMYLNSDDINGHGWITS